MVKGIRKFLFGLIVLVALLFLSSLALAQVLLPAAFYGSADFSTGEAIPDNSNVLALIDNSIVGSTVVKDGQYGHGDFPLIIQDVNGAFFSKTVTFEIDGKQANENAIYENGAVTQIDLTITKEAITPPSGGGGGSSGGGGGGTTVSEGQLGPKQYLLGELTQNTLALSEEDFVNFILDGKNYSTVLKEIGENAVTVTILISGKFITLELNSVKEMDLNVDGEADISILLNEINNKVAILTFKKLINPGGFPIAEEFKSPPQPTLTSGITGAVIGFVSSGKGVTTIIFLIVIVTLFIVVMVSRRKLKKQ